MGDFSESAVIRLTPSQSKKTDALIKNACCNYKEGQCLPLNGPCPQISSFSVICRYFREVLLNDSEGQDLQSELFKAIDYKLCSVCGKKYIPNSNRSKYCSACAKKVHRRQKNESYRNRSLPRTIRAK